MTAMLEILCCAPVFFVFMFVMAVLMYKQDRDTKGLPKHDY